MYSDVEDGLGWWRDTQFPTETGLEAIGVNGRAAALLDR